MTSDSGRLPVIGYRITGPDTAEIVLVGLRSSSAATARWAEHPVIFHGDGRDLGRDHMRQVFETAMVAELKPMLPEPIREAFTVAESLVDVTSARSDHEAVARLAGACTQVVVTAMFHAAGLGAVAPIVGAIDGMLSVPEPGRAPDGPSDEHTPHRKRVAEITEPPEIPKPLPPSPARIRRRPDRPVRDLFDSPELEGP